MNDIILNILERRSIRRYEDKAVSKETMAEILNAGAWAPSAMNRQTWRLTGIIDPEKVQKLAAAVKKALGAPQSEDYSFYHQLKDTCGDAGVRKLLTAFGVPEDHDVYACCAIGTALGGAKAPDRKAGATAIVE